MVMETMATKVNGTATLDGALKVVGGPGAYVDGTTYDILTGMY
jgi:hypothetical protein